ncbi:hypothetical protein BZM27_43565 [Paraburkholderia steynii]|uniref:Putative DNA-binding domain-containing protein n=1 Tax=Paraburkholderia steynii TaxID=1245441 RepID=A0A4R0XAU4_9BURK|nr:hypothetical protein BZM27_43565 [Paraburkholderia steynii]
MTFARLEWLQRTFASALDDPEHERLIEAYIAPVVAASDATAARATDQKTSDLYGDAVTGHGHDTIVRHRIATYRRTVRARWRAALTSAYPVLLALVGDAYFDVLSIAYARAHPSRSGDLNGFGGDLPVFIGEFEGDQRFGYFADVARLEWSLHVAWFAADTTPLTPDQWLQIDKDRLLDSQLAVNPACAAIASRYAIADIWRAHQPGGVLPLQLDIPTCTLVVRPQWRPEVLVQSSAAHAAFIALQKGKTLNEALDTAYALDADFDLAVQWQTWISTGAITGITAGAAPSSASHRGPGPQRFSSC